MEIITREFKHCDLIEIKGRQCLCAPIEREAK
jgi:hypothetical protein